MKLAIVRILAAVLLALPLQGCYTWHAAPAPNAGPIIQRERPRRVRMEVDWTPAQIDFKNPTLRNDSIFGEGAGYGVSIADVERLEVRRFSATRTALLTFTLGLYVIAVEADASDGRSSTGASGESGPFGCAPSCDEP